MTHTNPDPAFPTLVATSADPAASRPFDVVTFGPVVVETTPGTRVEFIVREPNGATRRVPGFHELVPQLLYANLKAVRIERESPVLASAAKYAPTPSAESVVLGHVEFPDDFTVAVDGVPVAFDDVASILTTEIASALRIYLQSHPVDTND